jgi:ATP-dependent DNA helicase RecG
LQIADLAKDGQLVILARQVAIELIQRDPNLEQRENGGIRLELKKQMKARPNWSKIS